MCAVGVEGVDVGGADVGAGVLDYDLDDLANGGWEDARYRVDAVVCEGAREGGEFDAVVFVEGDEVGFAWEGFDPGAFVLCPHYGAVTDY